jgi:hypothetical protein
MSLDSFVGEGLTPSPYKEVLAENKRLADIARAAVDRVRHEKGDNARLREELDLMRRAANKDAKTIKELTDSIVRCCALRKGEK